MKINEKLKKLMKSRPRGTIALITVLIVSSMLLSTGVAIVLSSIDLTLSASNINGKLAAEGLIRTCLEESMMKLKYDPAYTGNVNYNNGQGSCTAVISDNANPDYKDVSVTTDAQGYVMNSNYTADISQNPFELVKQ